MELTTGGTQKLPPDGASRLVSWLPLILPAK